MSEYSRGSHHQVCTLSPQEQLWFPQADLVRNNDMSDDPWWFARLAYRHRIVSTLFPRNFIQVVGAHVVPAEPVPRITPWFSDNPTPIIHAPREHRLFSKKAAIPEEHAVFSAHARPIGARGKVSSYDCYECRRHSDYHSQHNLDGRAYQIACIAKPLGIALPHDDPSDFCLDKTGSVVFFEIEDFNVHQLIRFLESQNNRNPRQERALHLSYRFRDLARLSKEQSKTGVHEFRVN
jgi:hypothetical protein